MIYQSIHLSNEMTKAKTKYLTFGRNMPRCAKCNERKEIAGGTRYRNKFGSFRFICRECKNAN